MKAPREQLDAEAQARGPLIGSCDEIDADTGTNVPGPFRRAVAIAAFFALVVWIAAYALGAWSAR